MANTLINEGCGPLEMSVLMHSLASVETSTLLQNLASDARVPEPEPESKPSFHNLRHRVSQLLPEQVADSMEKFKDHHEIMKGPRWRSPSLGSRTTSNDSAALFGANPRLSRDLGELPLSEAEDVPMCFTNAIHSERDRCIAMLQNLAQILDHEYASSGMAHWGSEDR